MKRILLLILLLVSIGAKAQYWTPGIPPGSHSFSPTFRWWSGTNDTLNNFSLSLGNKSYQLLTKAQFDNNKIVFTPKFTLTGDTIDLKDDTLTAFNYIILKNDSGNLTHSNNLYWNKATGKFDVVAPINFASDMYWGYQATLTTNFPIHNNGYRLNFDSLYSGNPTSVGTNRTIVVNGDSYAGSTGATTVARGYPYVLANFYKMTPIIAGHGGGAFSYPTGTPISFTSIPTKTSAMWKFVIEFGINDITNGYTAAQYKTNMTNFIDTCLARGWVGSDILLVNIPGAMATSHPSDVTTCEAYNREIDTLATTFGTYKADVWDALQDPKFGGYTWINYDGLHVNDNGHLAMAWTMAASLPAAFNITNQVGVFNGQTDVSTLRIKDYSIPDSLTLIGIDSLNNVHPVLALPPNIRTNRVFVQDGIYITKNAITPSSFDATKDIILMSSTDIYSTLGSGTWGSLELFNTNTGITTFKNHFVNPEYDFKGGTSDNLMLSIGVGGTDNALHPYYGVVFNGTNNAFLQTNSNKLVLEDVTGNYVFQSAFTTGNYLWNSSYGVNNATNPSMELTYNGHLILNHSGSFTDDNFAIETDSAVRFEGGVKVGILKSPVQTGNPTPSGSGGTLAANTYYYVITAVGAFGNETSPSNESHCTTTGSTSSVPISWAAITGAVSYRVYQGTSAGAESKYFTTTTNSATDIGSGYITAAPPTINSTATGGIDNNGNGTVQSLKITTVPTGTAGTDSLIVHSSNGQLKAIPASYYATSGGGGGTVTSITGGRGLTGGTITSTGTFTLDTTQNYTWLKRQTINFNSASAPTPVFSTQTLLQISGQDAQTTVLEMDAFGTSTHNLLEMVASDGTNASKTHIVSGHELGAYAFNGYYDATHTFGEATAAIQGIATQDYTSTNAGTQLKFNVTQNNTNTLTASFLLDQDLTGQFKGNVSVGQFQNPNIASDPSYDGVLGVTGITNASNHGIIWAGADANNSTSLNEVGEVTFLSAYNTANYKIARMYGRLHGTTANHFGSDVIMQTSPDNGSLTNAQIWNTDQTITFPHYTTANGILYTDGSGNVSQSTTLPSGVAMSGTLTATDATLTFSGSYNGGASRTVGLNLSNANTWTGAITAQAGITFSGNQTIVTGNSTPSSLIGAQTTYAAGTYTDGTTAAGTVSYNAANVILQPTFATSGNAITYTNGATFFFAGPPIDGAHVTTTNKYTIMVNSGNSYFGGYLNGTGGIGTAGTTTAANFFANSTNTIGSSQSTASLKINGTNSQSRWWANGNSSTALTASTSYANGIIGSSPVTTAASGTHPVLANLAIEPLGTVTSGGATTTETASLYVDNAGSGGTNNYAVDIHNGNVILSTAGQRLFVTEGTNGIVGQTTLVSGTKAITISGLTTSSRAIVTFVSAGGTVTTTWQYAAVCTSNTLTITALTSAGATDTNDTSVLNYMVIN